MQSEVILQSLPTQTISGSVSGAVPQTPVSCRAEGCRSAEHCSCPAPQQVWVTDPHVGIPAAAGSGSRPGEVPAPMGHPPPTAPPPGCAHCLWGQHLHRWVGRSRWVCSPHWVRYLHWGQALLLGLGHSLGSGAPFGVGHAYWGQAPPLG